MTPQSDVPTEEATLLLRLEGPMQFYATARSAHERRTHDHPTKAAVIGLVANAMGFDFSTDITPLAALRFAVTALRRGVIETDFKTVGTEPYAALPGDEVMGREIDWTSAPLAKVSSAPVKVEDWDKSRPGTVTPKFKPSSPKLIHEDYIADAAFQVALSGDADLLGRVKDALAAPARGVYLGRRAYSPTSALVDADSISTKTIDEIAVDWTGDSWFEVPVGTPGSMLINDQPKKYGPGQSRRTRAELFVPARTSTGSDSSSFDFFDWN